MLQIPVNHFQNLNILSVPALYIVKENENLLVRNNKKHEYEKRNHCKFLIASHQLTITTFLGAGQLNFLITYQLKFNISQSVKK